MQLTQDHCDRIAHCFPKHRGSLTYSNRRVIENAKRIHDLGKSESRSGLLIWGKGEPPLPLQTKFSGMPFRPAGLPWPRGEHGLPLPFIAQLNFSTLREHTYGKSLLQLFGEIVEDEVVEFHAEWHDLNDVSEFQLGSPPKHFPWPGQVFHAEVAEIECLEQFKKEQRGWPSYGQHLAFKMPLVLGGERTVDNIRIESSDMHLELLGQISVKNMLYADGTKINLFRDSIED